MTEAVLAIVMVALTMLVFGIRYVLRHQGKSKDTNRVKPGVNRVVRVMGESKKRWEE